MSITRISDASDLVKCRNRHRRNFASSLLLSDDQQATYIKNEKGIAAFNMTLGIVCNNTTLVAKEELHHPYSELVNSAATYFLRAHNLPTHAILANTIAQPLQQKNQTQQRN